MLKNYMEVFVEELLPPILNEYDNICKCPKCIEDIKAMALNRLKPLYVSTDKGHIFTKVNLLMPQFRTDIVKELTAAIKVVGDNPNHS